jgi:CHAT domain-containing protein/lipopolysaccharide biosynthesis regulator YciM
MTQGTKWRSPLEPRGRRRAYQALAGLSALLLFFSLAAAISSRQAFALVLFQQPVQQSRDTVSAGSDEKDVHALEAGKPIRRELAGGQEHRYQVGLNANQFLKVIVEQQWIDIVAQVSGAGGNQLLEFDSESRLLGREEVSLVAEEAGSFLLTVRPKLNGSSAGSYEIRIEELRAATEADRALQDARMQFKESLKMQSAGKYDEALPLAQRALEIREKFLGKDHPEIATSLDNLAAINVLQAKYGVAEPLYKRALDIHERVQGKDHPDTSASLYGLGCLYNLQGKYAEAEPLCKRALDIIEKALGKDHPDTGAVIDSVAKIYYSQGKYEEAEPLFTRALDIRERVLGKDHLETGASLTNLVNLYYMQGKYEEAEPLCKRALDINEKALGKDHPDTGSSLNDLAAIYYCLEKYAESESLYKRALDITEKALGKDHPATGARLNNLSSVYYLQGRYEEAEPLNKRAVDIYEKALGKDHPDTATTIDNLARIYYSQGKYEEAELLFTRAVDIYEKALGRDHPDTVASLYNLSALHTAKADLVQAVKFQSLANAAAEDSIAYKLLIGSERDKVAYLKTLSKRTDSTISLHIDSAPNDPTARSLAATIILQRKGRVLDAASQNLNALRSRFNAEDQALLNRLTKTRAEIAGLVLGGPQNMTAEQHQARIKELKDQAYKDEADISHRSKEFLAQSLTVTLEAVQAAIPPDSALIEFATYRPFNAYAKRNAEDFGQPRYVAYVLRHGEEIQFRDLGDAKVVDTAIASLRKTLRDSRSVDVKRLARAVDAKVFQPIRPLLGGKSRLLISPDGSLNLIPFAALVDERGRYALERYSISYLTSGRDLLRLQVARESKEGPLIIAAPDFGSSSEVEASLAKQENEGSEGEVSEKSARSSIKDFYFSPLPAAAQEGEALQSLLPGATLLTKGQATKAALSQVHGPKLLHIATHGFFLEDQDFTSAGGRGTQAISDDPDRALVQLEQQGARVEGPLLRSGLVLAGANEHKKNDNGILTALEVTGLNLWGTKLVTLSACDTGLGEVKNGDGVHGMRRALVLAGAETQIISLWSVSDRATQELMVSYYRKLRQGQGRGEGLRQAQLEMLKKENRQHPYYWACFIQSGEWANLDGKR